MPDEATSQPAPHTSDQATPLQEAATIPKESEMQTAQVPESEPLVSEPEPTSSATPSAPLVTPGAAVLHVASDLLVKARATIQFRKHKRLEKILAEIEKHGKITNDHVEKLLHVSDATATRYLSELEKGGKIKQVGKTGKAVTYTKA